MTKVKSVVLQVNSVNLYKNCRSKLLKCCANIYFNKQCLLKKVIPKYTKIKFGNSSPAAHVTTKKPGDRIILYNKWVYVTDIKVVYICYNVLLYAILQQVSTF
jgi:hypothetical protein